jgi:DNA-binding transcriptional regulator GbsR (MarR family)
VSARQPKTSAEAAPGSGELRVSRTAASSDHVHPAGVGQARTPETAATSGDGVRRASDESASPVPDGRKPDPSGIGRDQAAVRAFIERFTAKLAGSGFPRTPARIFVALLTSDSRTLTAAELADLLETSPASISGGVRYLIQVGLVAAEGEPGSRRQHYWMSDRVWQDIVQLRERQFTLWAAELQDGVRILGADSPAGVRMADTVRYFEFITAEMAGLLARWDSLNQAADSG